MAWNVSLVGSGYNRSIRTIAVSVRSAFLAVLQQVVVHLAAAQQDPSHSITVDGVWEDRVEVP